MATQKEDQPFRVIVVGAGLVGLAISHALQLANIEHVVLEKHKDIVSLHGAAFTLFPGAARIFDQFGILQKIQETVTPITKQYKRWPDGSIQGTSTDLQECGEKFQLPVVLFDRVRCVAALYDGLPDQSKIRTNARVERIEHTDNGVRVTLADGTIEEGDIVIGADGVHSIVRQIMWDYADKNEPNTLPETDKTAMFAQYKGLYGVSDFQDPSVVGSSDVHVIYGYNYTKLLFTQPGISYWAYLWKDEFSQPPKSYKPSFEEQEKVARKYKDTKFTETLTLETLWKTRTRGGLVNIEEGILDKWHAGRIVLVGDAAHKMTTDLGLGANIGIEGATVLCNILQRETKDNHNRHFSVAELSKLFQEYRDKRHARTKTFVEISRSVLKMHSYDTLWKRFFVSYIAMIPALKRYQNREFQESLAKSPKLDYVPTRTINEDAEGWKEADRSHNTSGIGWISYVLFATSAVAVSYAVASKL